MNSIFLILGQRLGRAIATMPDLDHRNMLLMGLIYIFLTLLLGLTTGFLRWNPIASGRVIFRVVTTSLFAPAIIEELCFRVLPVPYPATEGLSRSYLLWSGFSLLLFVIYHPLNALTFFPQGKETFFDPIFLSLAGILGLTCAIAYQQTGSLWIPVAIHWLAVVFWLLCFDGLHRLKMDSSSG
ncbi:MAG: CPBP family glutamic-type intramembrane protease [Cyanobacteria bacterium J06631_6]